ncbi:MAG: CoA transferase, partial [SAR324 cluster bacterium]|nr:CoA transferase [SAR324 cluster bacterium]
AFDTLDLAVVEGVTQIITLIQTTDLLDLSITEVAELVGLLNRFDQLDIDLGDLRQLQVFIEAVDNLGIDLLDASELVGIIQVADTLDISMFDGVISWCVGTTGPVFAEGRSPHPPDERTMGGAAFYQVYETKDGRYITLGGSELKFARNLLNALEREDLIELCGPPYGARQQPVKDFLAETFRSRTQAQWVEWFQDKDVCFGPVRQLHEAFAEPFLEERGMLLRDEAGSEHIGIPIKFQEEPGRVNFHAPGHGEHTEAILSGLGYDGAGIAALRDKGVI